MSTSAPSRKLRYRPPVTLPYLLSRSAGAVFAIWGALTIVFLALNLGGDPASSLVSPSASVEDIERVRRLYGYDQPLLVQYLIFFKNVATGDFPNSLRYATSPMALVFERFPNTLILALCGMSLGTVLGLAIGYASAFAKHWMLREIPMAVVMALQAFPPILLGVLLVLAFSIKLRWLPSAGGGSPLHLVLPSLTLGIYVAPAIARVFRTSILDVQNADHVRTALAKGVSPRMVRLRHVAANALIPVLNQIGLQLGAMLGGAVVVETIFSWPGIGQLAVGALNNQDFPVVLASVSFVAIVFVLVNLLVDILSAILDPRQRSVQ
ncbi:MULTISPECIES: ABC transporter permease [Chelativorans]|jgi:peptide/nickel transport system permease protein|uniref:Binding-protein-dependent transport systems inner membrane component n=1 Tax=Chelativorans sp. (strain BNC1) TaxID=266779 RepID=Q11BW7_CHESB|nr:MULTISPECIES: ABC transporter permease [Chelativorans]